MKFVVLHIHSYYWDGNLSPEEIIYIAINKRFFRGVNLFGMVEVLETAKAKKLAGWY